MSFLKVKIVKNFSSIDNTRSIAKITIKDLLIPDKKNAHISKNPENIDKNKSVNLNNIENISILNSSENKNLDFNPNFYVNKTKLDKVYQSKKINYDNPCLDNLSIEKDHYIGLIFIYSELINQKGLKNSKKQIFLNKTCIFSNLDEIPIIKLDNDTINQDFKYKKYIRNYINKQFMIKNKTIETIKLYETYGNYHIYCIKLNEAYDIKFQDYKWSTVFDFYYRNPKNLEPNQKEIYSSIIKKKNYCPYKKYCNKLSKDIPEYIKNYNIYYKLILEILHNLP